MILIRTIFLIISLVLVVEARERVNVSLSNLEIKEFVKLVSKISKKNILMTHKINGTVDLISNAPIYDDELMTLLVSVLESKGFTMMKKGSIYEIIRATDAAKHNPRVMKQGTKIRGSIMVTQTIKVTKENVDIVAAKIRYLISKTAKLMTMKESNIILITDYPRNIETVKRVIRDIEQNKNIVIKIIPILHAEAKKLQARITKVAKILFNEKVATQKVTVILDDNINGIILLGSQKNVDKLSLLIESLDVESNISNSVQIFTLKNSDSKAVLKTLNDIISKQKFADPAMKPNISSSEEINAVIVMGEPNVIKGIKLIIDELDKEKYQVYVQARIINISKKNTEDIGVKWGFSAGDASSSGLYAMSANFGSSELTTYASTAVNKAFGSMGSNGGSAFALTATLDFLMTEGSAQAVSNPSILCVNNKESQIYVGKTISISSGSTSVAGSTTASYKREDVGLTLKIKPRVSSSDKVTLDVETILENITDDGLSGGIPVRQPETSKQEVKTQAILRHGESIIIGGLVRTYTKKSVYRVPFLSKIWWIGDWLFSSNSESQEEDNLVVILTPYVIDRSEKLSQLQKDLGILTHIQEEYNKRAFAKLKELKLAKERSEEEKEEESKQNSHLLLLEDDEY